MSYLNGYNGKGLDLFAGDIVQTLVDQTIFLLKHNKDFNKISLR